MPCDSQDFILGYYSIVPSGLARCFQCLDPNRSMLSTTGNMHPLWVRIVPRAQCLRMLVGGQIYVTG